MLEFAYSLNSEQAGVIKDFPLDTLANYKTAGTNGVTKGDAVQLVSGLVRRAAAAASPKAFGVVEGIEFTGLAQGGTYAATNASQTASVNDTTKYANGVVKVRVDSDSVYRIALNSGTLAPANIGTAYDLVLDAAGDQKLALTTVNAQAKVIDYTTKNGVQYAFVTLVNPL
jgi:hypothetical protein